MPKGWKNQTEFKSLWSNSWPFETFFLRDALSDFKSLETNKLIDFSIISFQTGNLPLYTSLGAPGNSLIAMPLRMIPTRCKAGLSEWAGSGYWHFWWFPLNKFLIQAAVLWGIMIPEKTRKITRRTTGAQGCNFLTSFEQF